MKKTKILEHPSYGTINSSRVSSSKDVPLFGSSLRTNHTVRLQIQPAELRSRISIIDLLKQRK